MRTLWPTGWHKAAQLRTIYLGNTPARGPTGLRNYPYSTSADTNPLRYSSLKGMTDAHDMGEVWANTLHNVYAALVSAYGWSKVALHGPNDERGKCDLASSIHGCATSAAMQPYFHSSARRVATGGRKPIWGW
ncbi:hypothetical protein BJY52DRAFT_536563 [Lactarius psammicola]|nr:hypothetical protein BJY52DRAFT_536563 [Lactarius psammicola]